MSIYTVHIPSAEHSGVSPERFVFVRDGFSFWAFLLGPVWMLWHRLWLVLFAYAVLAGLLQSLLHLIDASTMVTVTVTLLLALLVGFEAATLRRMTLMRRGWANAGVVVGDDAESAERRFFDVWLHGAPQTIESSSVTLPARSAAAPAPSRYSDIIGLFPQPGASR